MTDWTSRSRSFVDRLPVDWHAASRATLFAVAAVVVLIALGWAVTASVTGAPHPIAEVGEVPIQPQAEQWDEAQSQTVKLSKQQMAIPNGGGSVDELAVRSLANESHVAFRLQWTDPTRDTNIASPGNYSDAGAVMFGTGEIPPITMGAVGNPVNIWYWRAAWQQNESAYGSGGMYSYPQDRAGGPSMPGQHADNPLSQAVGDRQAQHYYAEGFGSTSYAPSQPVRANATRTEDGWTVSFVRERTSDTEYDVEFTQGNDIYMAFAVWNGSQDERNGQKSITLQYRKLDPADGTLSAIDTGGSNSTGGSSNTGGGSDSGDGGASTSGLSLTGWMGVLVGTTLFVWTIVYWRTT